MSTLTVPSILQAMASVLPTHPPNDNTSDLASSYEAIALLVHAYLASLDFRLTGFQEDKPLPAEEQQDQDQQQKSSTTPSLARLPAQWNSGFGSLSFVYKHKQSAMTFVFRIDRMGAKVEVRGLAAGADNIYRFERTVRDVVKADKLPVRITIEQGQEQRDDLAEKLRAVFVSDQVIADLLNDLKVNIVQKLIPKLQKEGYVETEEAEETARSERRQQEAQNPLRPFPRDPRPNEPYPQPGGLPDLARPRPGPHADFPPPGFEDEYDINRPAGRGSGLVMPGGRSPFNIGHDDLHPPGLGPNDPLRGSFTGGGLPRPGGGMGGMHPTFDDPLFMGPGGAGVGGDGQGGYDPQAPPGARWDPIGPGAGPPRFGPNGGRGNNPFGGGGGGFGGFGGGDII